MCYAVANKMIRCIPTRPQRCGVSGIGTPDALSSCFKAVVNTPAYIASTSDVALRPDFGSARCAPGDGLAIAIRPSIGTLGGSRTFFLLTES